MSPPMSPSGPVVVSLIGLGTGRGQEVAGGQIAILGCPVTYGLWLSIDESMSIPAMAVEICDGTMKNPSSWPECPPKIDQRSQIVRIFGQIGGLPIQRL